MSVFHGHSLVSIKEEIILLKFIESMCFLQEEDALVDKLKGDISLVVRTISGREHIVSMNTVQKCVGDATFTNKELAYAILEKWLWIQKP